MAILHQKMINYFHSIFSGKSVFSHIDDDPVLMLAEYCYNDWKYDKQNNIFIFSKSLIDNAKKLYNIYGFTGVVSAYFENNILDQFIDKQVERKVIILKKGLKALPATKASIIFNGFNHDINADQIKRIYASYGLNRSQKAFLNDVDFFDINGRVEYLAKINENLVSPDELQRIHNRYLALRNYLNEEAKSKKSQITKTMKRTLFYHYYNNFTKYGMIGLFDRSKSAFRETKIIPKYESHIVINKIQHSEKNESYYVDYLKFNGVKADRSSISKIFSRWQVKEFKSQFISNLKHLEDKEINVIKGKSEEIELNKNSNRYVETNFITRLKGLSENTLFTDAPGLFILWTYLEELGIFQLAESLELTYVEKGYSWFDYLLYTVGRIFYGIPSYSAACNHEEPSLSFFTHLVKTPSPSTFLNGLDKIEEAKVIIVQQYLIKKGKELGLIKGKNIAFDFHQIDMDVDYELLRKFSKGPSPRKKICYSGFRPHLAWDLDTGNLIVAEFRKSSARGTTTFKRFTTDFLFPVLKENFENVYVDSEYTGKDVWNFIMDDETGMNAEIIACLKQNKFIKKHRDEFLLNNSNNGEFWKYWDKKHVYSKGTFVLEWEYINPASKSHKMSLNCVVKKNIETGKLRCFGTSISDYSSEKILKEYSNRWLIENGIKDLIGSYYLDKVPGTRPNLINVHFLIVSICRYLYQMIQNDMGEIMMNPDNTQKMMNTMRNQLFRQGCGKITLNDDTIEIKMSNSYSPKLTSKLNYIFQKINSKAAAGLNILGGFKLKYFLLPPHGNEYKNNHTKDILDIKNF